MCNKFNIDSVSNICFTFFRLILVQINFILCSFITVYVLMIETFRSSFFSKYHVLDIPKGLKFIILRRKSLVSIYVFSSNQQYCIYHCQILYMSCIIITLHVPFYCVTNNASIRLYQPNFKMHDVHVLR